MAKKILRVSGIILLIILLSLTGIGLYLKYYLPNIKVKVIKISATEDRIERGKYLANHVLGCIDCHSARDWSYFAGPLKPGTEGMGGEKFDQQQGLPGVFVATNITPYELSDWSDGEIYRAITAGVGKKNNAIFPIMPYYSYGSMDDEDVYDVIAYLRSMPAIPNDLPGSKPDFPVNLLINTMPRAGTPVKRPNTNDTLKYGEYITKIAACIECHTPANEKGELIMEKAYAGGRKFLSGDKVVTVSTNITFDKNTGLGDWSEEDFIETFKGYDPDVYKPYKVENMSKNTTMPWTIYGKLDTLDLRAMYYYLKSLPPIEN